MSTISDLACPACGAMGALKISDPTVNRAYCEVCLFPSIVGNGSAREDLETPIDTTHWTFDDMLAHPETLRVLARRMAEQFGNQIPDDQNASLVANYLDSQLPKPSGSSLA